MATKSDFDDDEWTALQRGVMGSAMLVSLAERDFTDSFGEAGAMAKFLQGQQVAASSALIRELANAHGTGFGIMTSPEKLRVETGAALQTAIKTLESKAPGDVGAYRTLVLGVAQAVADAKGGVGSVETAMIAEISKMLGDT